MKNSRVPGRLLIFAWLLPRLLLRFWRRKPAAAEMRRIVVLHQFLLGDALMATSLLAKLRQQHPAAEILLACPPLQAEMYAAQPYGVRTIPWSPRDFSAIWRLCTLGRVDWALLMGENRLSFLARAMGARWVSGFAGETPAYKNWLLDEAVPYASEPEAWSDTAARLVPGPAPAPFALADWPLPQVALPDLPARFVLLHVGASSATRYWPAANWTALAQHLRARGLAIVWSCGPGEQHLLPAGGIQENDVVLAGSLRLPQLRAVMAQAAVNVCPDTGVAHLAKTTGRPLVMLFGPGAEVLFGPGQFFGAAPFAGVGPVWFPCRNQRSIHHREVDWVLRCGRRFGDAPPACKRPLCMEAIQSDAVAAAVGRML
ncbi:glycosyltransferase family 9 protein [Vogesella oryzae]|uniref:glycosyltransferase family 9 protein n=1 Tax=Vogesella oryzae TaxID=1735285 RepID=UPI001582E182|nr:glycosyltransferase family 9 protein [Vogesella oryzae]